MHRAVYAGSFDPITNGHLWMIDQGRRLFDELVVAVGVNPDKKYLFPLDQRLAMIRETTAAWPNVTVASFENLFLVHYARQVEAAFILRGIRNEQDYGYERGMRYVNAEFDAQVQTVFLIPPRELVEVSSSFVKGLVGPRGWPAVVRKYVPEAVFSQFVARFGDDAAAAEPPTRPQAEANPESLRRRWEDLWRRAGAAGDMGQVFEGLVSDYTNPARHYHDLRHIAQCLAEFDTVRQRCEEPDAVEAAVWFHDWVYDPTRGDNEEASAAWAAEAIRAMGGSEALADRVSQLVLATKHAEPAATPDAALLADIDLSILGRPAAEFDAYERAIREEYRHVGEPAFRAGRAKILRRFLERPGVYGTDVFRERYERQARENLARSVARLEAAEAPNAPA